MSSNQYPIGQSQQPLPDKMQFTIINKTWHNSFDPPPPPPPTPFHGSATEGYETCRKTRHFLVEVFALLMAIKYIYSSRLQQPLSLDPQQPWICKPTLSPSPFSWLFPWNSNKGCKLVLQHYFSCHTDQTTEEGCKNWSLTCIVFQCDYNHLILHTSVPQFFKALAHPIVQLSSKVQPVHLTILLDQHQQDEQHLWDIDHDSGSWS